MVTVLFTDLVASTDALSRLGADQNEAVRREHFALLRGVLTKHAGREVKNLGDGFMVVFATPSAALDAAVEMQQRLDARNRRAAEPLLMRVGISLGEVEAEDEDYFGPPVVEAARLCRIAEGATIVTSDVVRVLAAPRGRHVFEALGALDLKGFDAQLEAYTVTWAPFSGAEIVGLPLPPRLAMAADATFVGRENECALLLDALAHAERMARRRVVLVGGEPGIGKTTLVAAAARCAHDEGALVLYGRCDEELSIPYQPWREAVAFLAQHELIDDADRARLALLLPDGGARVVSGGPGADAERYALFGAVIEVLARVSDVARIVLVLDDLHWADAPTVSLLRHLATASEQLRVLVVATYRDAEVDGADALAGTLAALHREDGVDRVHLTGLGGTEVLQLIERLAGHELGEDGLALRDVLVRETEGNPFFVGEILRHLAEIGAIAQPEGRWIATTDLRTQGLPVSLREVIGRRVARLGDGTRRALEYASVVGRDFDLELLAELLELEPDATFDCLEPAVANTLLEEVAPGRFSFTHALVEHSLYNDLAATRRTRLHRRVAQALTRYLGPDPGARAGELAYHWAEAAAPDDLGRAVVAARAAADFALAHLAPDEARRWYSRALEWLASDAKPDDIMRAALCVGLGEAQEQTGEPGYRETLLDAARCADALGATDLVVRAALANSRGFASRSGAVDHERIEVLERAIDVAVDDRDRAMLLATLSAEVTFTGREPTVRAARDAVTVARRTGDDATLARVVARIERAIASPDTVSEREVLMRDGEAAAIRTHDPVLIWSVASCALHPALERGDRDEYDRRLEMTVEFGNRVGQPQVLWVTGLLASLHAYIDGDLERAEDIAASALDIGLSSGQPDAFDLYAGQLFAIRQAQGRLDEMVALVEETAAANPSLPIYRAALAAAYCMLDRGDDARRVSASDFADGFAAFPRDSTWLSALYWYADVAARLDASGPAAALVELIAPWRDLVSNTGITSSGSAASTLGVALATCGRFDEASEAFEQGLAVNGALDAPILLARTHLDYGRMLLRSGEPERARLHVEAALAIARELGLGDIEREAAACL
jgi:tetratricopeptide (TPR) repeat protein